MNTKRLAVLALAGPLLLVATAVYATGVLPAPPAPAQEYFIYLPFVARDYPPDPPLYRLYADPADLAWLAQEPYRDETIPATFCTADKRWDVDVRYRGDVSRLMPKKCWKAFFPGSDLFENQEELNLNADYPDQTLLRSYLAYDFLARAGVPTPRAGFARLNINDVYYGLFSQVEQIDERFLYRQGIDVHGNLYKPYYGNLSADDWSYAYHYPKKTNRQSGIEDIVAFIELINDTPDAQFPLAIAGMLDVNGWLDWYAANVLIGNFEMLEKNYYLYHDLSVERWMILPWDVDISLGHNTKLPAGGAPYANLLDEEISWDNPIDSGTQESKKSDGKWNVLIDRMMGVPEFRWFHCRRLEELMAGAFSPAEMFPRIEAAFAHVRAAAEADPNRWRPAGFQFSDGPDELKTYIVNRIQFLDGEMPGFCPDLEAPLTVNEFLADNESTVADEAGETDPWIEIHNGSATLAWDLGGMYLTDVLSEPTKWRIPDDTLIPPGGVLLLWADGEESEGPLHANFALNAGGGQIGLFDRDVFGHAAISTLTYTAQATDVSRGRMPDGSETWQSFAAPTPGWLNQGRAPAIGGTVHTPTWPTAGSPVTVTTSITDEGTVTATLWYRAFAAGVQPPEYQAAPMVPVSGASWQLTLQAQASGTWVEYYVEAQNTAGLVSVDRPGWPAGDYRYVVGWQRPPLYVNELMALNTRTMEDEDGDYDDWIEVYNAGPVDVDMGGMYFSNNVGLTAQYTIPAGTLVSAGGYRLFWADGTGVNGHLNFKLSGAGEYVGLFDKRARYYAPVDAVYFDAQVPDVSWGRFPDGGAWCALDTPTPGGRNRLAPPRFSEVTRVPAWPGAGESVTVTAVVTAGSPIVSATLWYDAGSGFQAMPMVQVSGASWQLALQSQADSGTSWQLVLPAQAEGTLVSYYLEAVDSVGQKTLHPTAAPADTHHYLVGYAPPRVLVNELLAANDSANQDEAGEYDDWLELYNASAATVTLDGMHLTDDLAEPTHWQFPAGTTVAPGGHLLVWCDEDPEQGLLHANFKLNREGEEIGLFDADAHGNVLLDTIIFGPQQTDVSWGRKPDGAGTWRFLDPPTPGASNG